MPRAATISPPRAFRSAPVVANAALILCTRSTPAERKSCTYELQVNGETVAKARDCRNKSLSRIGAFQEIVTVTLQHQLHASAKRFYMRPIFCTPSLPLDFIWRTGHVMSKQARVRAMSRINFTTRHPEY